MSDKKRKKIISFTKICLLITSIFLFSCEQPANPPKEPLAPSTISTEQINANIKKSGIAKDVELQTTIQNVSYKLILSASSGTFNASKNERAANNSCSGSFFYKDSYVFINIEDDSTFLKIFVDKVIDEMNKLAVKAKSEIENSSLVISSNKTSTSITSDDYTNAKTSFTEKVEDYLTGLTEEEPPAENPPAENPFIDDPSVSQSLKESAEYKLLREVGFTHITGVDVPVEAGKYQPKTGEIVELYYNDLGMYPTTYTLNRELSKDGHLVYDRSRYKEIFGLDTLKTSIGDDEFSFDAKNKTLTHYTPDDNPNHYQYSYIKRNDDGSFTYGRYKNTPNDGSLLLDDPMSFDKSENSVGLYMDISFKLANETKQEPTDEDPTVEDPTIETPTVDIANAPIVNAIRELGFGIDIVDVEPVEGLYTPETGDLVDLKFTDYDIDIAVQMQLDREKSTKDNLVYKCVKRWDIVYDEDVDAQDFHDRYFDKMTFDKENHSVSFFHTNDDNTEMRLMTIRIELDENNKPSFIYNGIGNDYKDHAQEVDNGEVFKASWFTQYDEIEIILAK